MDTACLTAADDELALAHLLLPAYIPVSWTGIAASACDERLATLAQQCAALPGLLADVRAAIAALDRDVSVSSHPDGLPMWGWR